jgi:hypothetical protein
VGEARKRTTLAEEGPTVPRNCGPEPQSPGQRSASSSKPLPAASATAGSPLPAAKKSLPEAAKSLPATGEDTLQDVPPVRSATREGVWATAGKAARRTRRARAAPLQTNRARAGCIGIFSGDLEEEDLPPPHRDVGDEGIISDAE